MWSWFDCNKNDIHKNLIFYLMISNDKTFDLRCGRGLQKRFRMCGSVRRRLPGHFACHRWDRRYLFNYLNIFHRWYGQYLKTNLILIFLRILCPSLRVFYRFWKSRLNVFWHQNMENLLSLCTLHQKGKILQHTLFEIGQLNRGVFFCSFPFFESVGRTHQKKSHQIERSDG